MALLVDIWDEMAEAECLWTLNPKPYTSNPKRTLNPKPYKPYMVGPKAKGPTGVAKACIGGVGISTHSIPSQSL